MRMLIDAIRCLSTFYYYICCIIYNEFIFNLKLHCDTMIEIYVPLMYLEGKHMETKWYSDIWQLIVAPF